VQRLSAEHFMAEILAEAGCRDLPPALRERLLQVARMAASARVQELEKVFAEAARG